MTSGKFIDNTIKGDKSSKMEEIKDYRAEEKTTVSTSSDHEMPNSEGDYETFLEEAENHGANCILIKQQIEQPSSKRDIRNSHSKSILSSEEALDSGSKPYKDEDNHTQLHSKAVSKNNIYPEIKIAFENKIEKFRHNFLIVYVSLKKCWPSLLAGFPCILFLLVPILAYSTMLFIAALPMICIAICIALAFLPFIWPRIEPKIKIFKPSNGFLVAFSLISVPFMIAISIPIFFFAPLLLFLLLPCIFVVIPAIMLFLLPVMFGMSLLIGIVLLVFHYSLKQKIDLKIRELRSWNLSR